MFQLSFFCKKPIYQQVGDPREMCHLGKPDKNWPKGPGSKESFTKKINLRQFFFHLS